MNAKKNGAKSFQSGADRPFAVRTSSRLLLIESLILLIFGMIQSTGKPIADLYQPRLAIVWIVLGFYGSWVSLRFFREATGSRNQAVLLQGLLLGSMLLLYTIERPLFAYPFMVFGILMVLYLQHPDVQARFAEINAPRKKQA
jgi:FtsH-binding integral membrane protein